jgi:hemolysin-activating ACP:hemolysin acyltransferase
VGGGVASPGRLQTLDDWRSGETVRVMTTMAPFGGKVKL